MKEIKIILLALLVVLIIWIDLPENLTVKIPLGKKKIEFKINPLTIDWNLFGLKIKRSFSTKLGLDLKGGSHLVFETDISKLKKEDTQDAINSARDIIEKRVNFFGISEPTVQTVKSGLIYRISVDLPGMQDVSTAVQLIGKTAQLDFYEETPTNNPTEATSSSIFSRLTTFTGLSGKHIKKATVDFDNQTGKPIVALEFTDEGSKIFADVTKKNINKPVAIVIDNMIISAPTVKQAITEGTAVISGNFNVDEAKKLAISINSGALPVPIKLVEQRNVGPSLGEAEINKSVYAGAIGLFMVLIFMIAYYGRLGLIASLALLIYGLISFAIFRIIPIVLTLPGVAGFILSIGMAVDSNILIFERIKEETRKGKTFEVASRLGFGRAIDAIKDANLTTLTVAFILFNPLNWEFLPQFGMVRGFALTLAIGVATSLFTGVVITKRLIEIFYKNKK